MGKECGVEMVSEKVRTSEAHFLLILPFSDSWPTGSLSAASSEGGEPPESDSFFARDEGISVQQRACAGGFEVVVCGHGWRHGER